MAIMIAKVAVNKPYLLQSRRATLVVCAYCNFHWERLTKASMKCNLLCLKIDCQTDFKAMLAYCSVIYLKWTHINPHFDSLGYLAKFVGDTPNKKPSVRRISLIDQWIHSTVISDNTRVNRAPVNSCIFSHENSIYCNRPIHIIKSMLEYQGKLDIFFDVNNFTNHRHNFFFSFVCCCRCNVITFQRESIY